MGRSDDSIIVTMPAHEDAAQSCLIGTRVRVVGGTAPESQTIIPDPDGPYEVTARAPAAGRPDRLRFSLRKIG